MRARQWEVGAIMIERCIIPVRWVVAGCAIRAKFTVVLIFIFMAGITVDWCALEDIVYVAFLASHLAMLAFKFESG